VLRHLSNRKLRLLRLFKRLIQVPMMPKLLCMEDQHVDGVLRSKVTLIKQELLTDSLIVTQTPLTTLKCGIS
jgi:hypothetical protein